MKGRRIGRPVPKQCSWLGCASKDSWYDSGGGQSDGQRQHCTYVVLRSTAYTYACGPMGRTVELASLALTEPSRGFDGDGSPFKSAYFLMTLSNLCSACGLDVAGCACKQDAGHATDTMTLTLQIARALVEVPVPVDAVRGRQRARGRRPSALVVRWQCLVAGGKRIRSRSPPFQDARSLQLDLAYQIPGPKLRTLSRRVTHHQLLPCRAALGTRLYRAGRGWKSRRVSCVQQDTNPDAHQE